MSTQRASAEHCGAHMGQEFDMPRSKDVHSFAFTTRTVRFFSWWGGSVQGVSMR